MKNIKSSALISGGSKTFLVTQVGVAPIEAEGHNMRVLRVPTELAMDAQSAVLGPDVNGHQPQVPLGFGQKDFGNEKLNTLVGQDAKFSQYCNGVLLSDAGYTYFMVEIIKSIYPSRASLWIVESHEISNTTFDRTLCNLLL